MQRRRSVLYVPASNARALEKAAGLTCDGVILDLEDSVAPEAKDRALAQAAGALADPRFAGRERIVRVNGFSDDPAEEDRLARELETLAPLAPEGILFPKIRFAPDAERASRALDAVRAPPETRLWLMIETPQSVLDLPRIAALAAGPEARLAVLVMGLNDLAKEMRVAATASRLALLPALGQAVLAARSYGLDVLDGVFGDLVDPDGFEAEARQGRGIGFDGKTLIHPAQIAPANRIFSPSPGEVAEAAALVAAFEAPENAGKGVLVVNGRMAERLHFEAARRVLALADGATG